MNPENVSIENLKSASSKWKQKITDLEQKADGMTGGKEQETLDLIDRMKAKQSIIEQYLHQLEAEDRKSWDQKVSELDRMFKDVDKAYREAMAYFY